MRFADLESGLNVVDAEEQKIQSLKMIDLLCVQGGGGSRPIQRCAFFGAGLLR